MSTTTQQAEPDATVSDWAGSPLSTMHRLAAVPAQNQHKGCGSVRVTIEP